jgi:hypothetical protein
MLLLDGVSLTAQGYDAHSEFGERAIAEARRLKLRLLREQYDQREAEYLNSRPRPGDRPAVKSRYFPAGW